VRRVHFSEEANAAICVQVTPSIVGHVITITCTGMRVAEFVPLGRLADHDIMLATANSYADALRQRYVELSMTQETPIAGPTVQQPDAGVEPECESCGRTATVRLTDGSLWCWSCHTCALDAGYDLDLGTVLDDGAPA